MGDVVVVVVLCLLYVVQCFVYCVVVDGVDVDQLVVGVGGVDQFVEVCWVDQQFVCFFVVVVGFEECGGLCWVFWYVVGEYFDFWQGQVGVVEEVLVYFVQYFEVGWLVVWIGDQEGGDVGIEFVVFGQLLVDWQYVDGVFVGFEVEQGVVW